MGKLFLLFLFLFGSAHADGITAKSWLVADDSGVVLEGVNTNAIRSIASITKLLTVMVVLDAEQDLDELIKTPRYRANISRRMLMDMALVRSDNTAADSLCRHYSTGYSSCIRALNEKAAHLGMMDTRFYDPTGLNKKNVSTAEDLVKLVLAAAAYPLIVDAGSKGMVTLQTKRGSFIFRNTNPLVGQGYSILVSKTGFINRAGGCLVVRMLTMNGIRTIIILGSRNTHTRAPEAMTLLAKYDGNDKKS